MACTDGFSMKLAVLTHKVFMFSCYVSWIFHGVFIPGPASVFMDAPTILLKINWLI